MPVSEFSRMFYPGPDFPSELRWEHIFKILPGGSSVRLMYSLAVCISPSSWFFRMCGLFSGVVLPASDYFFIWDVG